jgi:transposase
MDVVAAYQNVGTFRGAAELCGVDPKTVKRKVLAHEAGLLTSERAARRRVPRNTDAVRATMLEHVRKLKGKASAKRMLPIARAAGYTGSDRNFRRLIAEVKRDVRAEIGRYQRRPAIWVPGETLVIDWGTLPGGLKVFCAVLAWSRVRFVRVARDETAVTTLALLAECFEMLGGVPAKVLADRMACLKGGVIANVVIPTADYVRFATHYKFTPDFCHAHDPESKGIVEHLVGYAKRDMILGDSTDLGVLNETCADWCGEVNTVTHSETCQVPMDRLDIERSLLRVLPMLRPRIGKCDLRKVGKLSTIKIAGAVYSVPYRLVGRHVECVTFDDTVTIYDTTGDVVAQHSQLPPGESSICDEHYPTPRALPSRRPVGRTDTEKVFLQLGEPAANFITAGAAAGVTTLHREISEIVNDLLPAHGDEALIKALTRATRFGRFKAGDIRSILAIGPVGLEHVTAGEPIVVTLPTVEVRSLDAYRIENLA